MQSDELATEKTSRLSTFLHFVHRLPASDRVIFHVLLVLVIASSLLTLTLWSTNTTSTVPAHNGTIVEGMVGSARFINPVLANTAVDRDLSALVYQGVLKLDQDGELIPDLARSVTTNEDGTQYDIELRQNVQFHDGRPVTARDVIFTYELAQDSDLMSPHRGNWSNVQIEQTDTFSIRLTLNEAYYPFQENLTLGILPAHIWDEVSISDIAFSTRNTQPIGSGPYAVSGVTRDEGGSISDITLQAHDQKTTPISTINVKLYPNHEMLLAALATHNIDTTTALRNEDLTSVNQNQYQIHSIALPRVISLVFNQNRSPALRDRAVREALSLSINREAIIEVATAGTGIPTATPIPAGYNMLESSATSSPRTPTSTASTTAAIERLRAGDWEQTDDGVWVRETDDGTIPLQVTIRTFDRPNFSATAEAVATAWREIGVEVNIEEYEHRDLLEGVLRPRDFEVLLFGMDVSRSVDLYPFWHSSQQTDPGLNVAQYTNISADGYLATLRTETDQSARYEAESLFLESIAEEVPAVFLYTPTLPFVAHKDIQLILPKRVQTTADRWALTGIWHNATEDIWPILRRENLIIDTSTTTDRE